MEEVLKRTLYRLHSIALRVENDPVMSLSNEELISPHLADRFTRLELELKNVYEEMEALEKIIKEGGIK